MATPTRASDTSDVSLAGSPRIAIATLVLAVAAFGVAVHASVRPTTGPATAATCDHAAMEAELARLRERVDIAERAVSRQSIRRVGAALEEQAHTSSTPADESVEVPTEDDAADEPERFQTAPVYTRIEAPSGLEVTQAENGAFAVRNTDPGLANRVIIVKARREDGTIDDVPIAVPPPS
jgi:hypothetical protein